MKLNKEALKRIIKEELNNVLHEAGDFNPQYRMQQMMKGRGRVMMAVKDPNDTYNYVPDDLSGDGMRDEKLFSIYSALQQADTIVNRLNTKDMEEAKRIGMNSLSDLENAEVLIRSDLRPADKGGLKYMSSMVEGAAAHMFIVRLIGIIKSL
tara:strand:- start:423 stop:878 length:456 start_codon:yes stop_codon:yes gene_type:complete